MPARLRSAFAWSVLLAASVSLPAFLWLSDLALPEVLASWSLLLVPLASTRWLRFLPSRRQRRGVPESRRDALARVEAGARTAVRRQAAAVLAPVLVVLAVWINAANLLGIDLSAGPSPPPPRRDADRDSWDPDAWRCLSALLALEVAVAAALAPEARRQRRRIRSFLSDCGRPDPHPDDGEASA